MNLLLSAYACEPGRGSEPGFGWNWAVHLAAEGHRVHVLTAEIHRAAVEARLAGRPVEGLGVTFVATPAWAEPVLRGQAGVYLRYFLWQHDTLQIARGLHARRPFDLAHHVTWGSVAAASPLGGLGVPHVLGPVGGGQVAPPGFQDYFAPGWPAEAVRSALMRHVVPRLPAPRRRLAETDLVLATNRDTKALAERMGAPRVELLLDSGLPAAFFSRPPRKPSAGGPLRVLWVGRLMPRKALRLSLEALARMQRPSTMTVLGDGPQGPRVADWVRTLRLEGRVDWRGHVPWETVRAAYRNHDLLLFASLRDSFGSQLLEAMANALPIVTLDLHGAGDLVPDAAAAKVPVGSPGATAEGLARALDALHADPERRLAMGRVGRRFAEEHRWAAKARRMSARYERLLGRRAPAPV